MRADDDRCLGYVKERTDLCVTKRPTPDLGMGMGDRLGSVFNVNSTRRNLNLGIG